MNDPLPFNPLDKKNLAASVGEALLDSAPSPLGDIDVFKGAGIYAIYYLGKFDAYDQISDENADGRWASPIYVGKAIPSGGRKGGEQASALESRSLVGRLREHGESVRSANNLEIRDFWCRYLVVDDIWIPLGENLMIAKFAPVWNALVDGFGNHDPGKGRYSGMRSRWNVLHPGRSWADRCKARPESQEAIVGDVKSYLAARPRPLGKLFRN